MMVVVVVVVVLFRAAGTSIADRIPVTPLSHERRYGSRKYACGFALSVLVMGSAADDG